MVAKNRCYKNYELLFIVMFIIHDVPIIGYFFPSFFYALIVVFLSIFLFQKMNNKWPFNPLYLFGIPFLCLIFHVFVKSDIISLLQEFSGFFQVMMYTMIALPLLKKNDVEQARFILGFYLFVNFITCVTTGYGCTVYPGASRFLAVGGENVVVNYRLFKYANIGGFSFVYTMVLTFPIVVYFFRNGGNNKKYKFLSLCFFFCIWYMIVKTEYTTALLLSFVFLSLFFLKQRNIKKSRIIFILLLFFLFVESINTIVVSGIEYVAATTESQDVSDRMRDLALKLDGKELENSASDLEDRNDKYFKSIITFLNNPLGIWTEKSGIGGHSYIFDKSAIFGILGIVLICIMLRTLYLQYVMIYRGSNIYLYSVFLYVGFCILLLVNTTAFYTPLTFTLPLLSLSLNQINKL